MKKFFLCFALIFSLSFFCSCQKVEKATIDENYILLSVDFSSNGSVMQSIRFHANSKKINELSSSVKEELDFRKALQKQIGEIRKEFLFTFALNYVSNPCDEFKINQGLILTDVNYDEALDCVGFDILFTSVEAWNYYHSPSQEKDEKASSSSGNIFYQKFSSTGSFPFSSIRKGEKESILMGQLYKSKYLAAAEGLSFKEKLAEEYKPTFVYNYSTPQSRLRSNANSCYRGSDRRYHHVWVVQESDLNENNKICLSMTIIYQGWWIFFATFIPLAIGGTIITIIVIKDKTSCKKGEKAKKKRVKKRKSRPS